jgi:branched-chain amino acid transport system substrate-binding protein
MRRMKIFLKIGVIWGIFLLSFSPTWAQEPKEIRIGILTPLTGALSALGINAKNGCEMAAIEINETGGIKALGGAKIKIVNGDSEGKADTGMSVAERLIKREGVVACLSGPQSGVTFATTQVTEKYQIPHMITGSIADEITARGFKYIFRIIPTSTSCSLDELKLINWARKKGIKIESMAFFYEDTLWGQGQVKVWKANKGDLKIAADLPYPHGTSDLSVTVTKLKAAKPDVVLCCNYVSDAILMMKTMFEMDFNCQAIIGTGAGLEDPLFFKNLGDLSENVITSCQYTEELNPFSKKAGEKYLKLFNQPIGGHSITAYAGIYVIADALNRSGSTDPKKLRDALAKTNLCSGPATNVLPVKCIKFDETGQFDYSILFAQWKKGKLIPISPQEFSKAEAVWPMPTWKERGLRK